MKVRVATFNLNNLFSRYNFRGEVDAAPGDVQGGLTLSFDHGDFEARTFMGRLVKAKDERDTQLVADRIKDVVQADVLAVQEVEHLEILKKFNTDHLNGMYPYIALIEGNDRRMIDVGILSKLPIGMIVSHQTAEHPDAPGKRVFSRDLLQVEILDPNRRKLFTIYNTHLKSHFVPFGQDPVQGAVAANLRRKQQAEMISQILSKMERPDGKFVLTGDMNDPPDSPHLQPMLSVDGQLLVDALADPGETRDPKPESPGQGPGPSTRAWTHRFNPSGPPEPEYELYDHIWLSPKLGGRMSGPMIDRRTKHGGDGSDHDPAWVDLAL